MGTIKLILVFALLGALVYVGVEVIPPYFANYEFQDTLETEARLGTYSTRGDDVIRDAVFKRAQELEIPVTKEQIKVMRSATPGNAGVSIETEYSVQSICPGTPWISRSILRARTSPLFNGLTGPASSPSRETPAFLCHLRTVANQTLPAWLLIVRAMRNVVTRWRVP